MKALVLLGVVAGALVGYGMGYHAGALDQGMTYQEKIDELELALDRSDEAFAQAYKKFVGCVRANEKRGGKK